MDVLPPPGHAPVRGSVLSLNDVSLRYKRRTILHGISLSAGRGEVIGVVGHNGAGKDDILPGSVRAPQGL